MYCLLLLLSIFSTTALLYLLLSLTTVLDATYYIFYCYLAISSTATQIIVSEVPMSRIIFHLPSSACSIAFARAPPVLVDGRCFILPYLCSVLQDPRLVCGRETVE